MAGLRRLFDHPRILADDSPICRQVACAPSFISSLALYLAVARVDGDVGRGRIGHAALARRIAVSRRLDVGRGGFAVRLRAVCLFAICKGLQCQATRRIAGSSWRKSRAAAGNGWNPLASAASGISGASVRDAGMERRNRARGVLGPDSVRRGHGSGDDPYGG